MKYSFAIIALLCILQACTDDQPKKLKPNRLITKHGLKKPKLEADTNFSDVKKNLRNFEKGKVDQVKSYQNGIVIKWINQGNGQKVKKGDMVLMEYRLALPDGKIIDGNNKLNVPAIPFLIGYNMQTPGWDLALSELKIGDFAKIEIPADLAFGSKSIKGVVPANSPMWLYVKLYAVVTPGLNEEGIRSWKIKDGKESAADNADSKEISFHSIVSTETKASVMNTYLSNFPIKYIPGQKTIVPGLRKILKNAKKGERYLILLDSKQAYGTRGYANLIQPNEDVLFNIEVIDVREI